MAKNVKITEGDGLKNFDGVKKLRVKQLNGDCCDFIPESDIKSDTKEISYNGTYVAEDEGYQAYSKFRVTGFRDENTTAIIKPSSTKKNIRIDKDFDNVERIRTSGNDGSTDWILENTLGVRYVNGNGNFNAKDEGFSGYSKIIAAGTPDLPDAILCTKETVQAYEIGEKIGFYDLNVVPIVWENEREGTYHVWRNENYPDGKIPLKELEYQDPTYAYVDSTEPVGRISTDLLPFTWSPEKTIIDNSITTIPLQPIYTVEPIYIYIYDFYSDGKYSVYATIPLDDNVRKIAFYIKRLGIGDNLLSLEDRDLKYYNNGEGEFKKLYEDSPAVLSGTHIYVSKYPFKYIDMLGEEFDGQPTLEEIIKRGVPRSRNNKHSFTYLGKTVYLNQVGEVLSEDFEETDFDKFIAIENRRGFANLLYKHSASMINRVAWISQYGMEVVKQKVPIKWKRPVDGKELETTYNVIVIPGVDSEEE